MATAVAVSIYREEAEAAVEVAEHTEVTELQPIAQHQVPPNYHSNTAKVHPEPMDDRREVQDRRKSKERMNATTVQEQMDMHYDRDLSGVQRGKATELGAMSTFETAGERLHAALETASVLKRQGERAIDRYVIDPRTSRAQSRWDLLLSLALLFTALVTVTTTTASATTATATTAAATTITTGSTTSSSGGGSGSAPPSAWAR